MLRIVNAHVVTCVAYVAWLSVYFQKAIMGDGSEYNLSTGTCVIKYIIDGPKHSCSNTTVFGDRIAD